MLKFLQSLFGKKETVKKQPEFHEEIRAQVEAGAVKVEVTPGQPQFNAEYDPVANPAKKSATKKAGAKKAPAKSADKKPAKKPAKSKKQ